MESRFAALLIALAVAALGWFLLLRGDVTPGTDQVQNSEGPGSTRTASDLDSPTLQSARDDRQVLPADVQEIEEPAIRAEPRLVEFSGVVIDTHQRPVPNATVEAKLFGKVIATMDTDEQGRYSFRHSVSPMDDRFSGGTVVARGPAGEVGYETFYYRDVMADAPDEGGSDESIEHENISPILLRAGGSIRVSVAMSCDDSLPARVWIVKRERGHSRDDVIAVDYTNERGQLKFDGLEPGRYRVVAATKTCGRDSAWVEVEREDVVNVALRIPESRTLEIRVLEKDTQKPIAGARVVAQEVQSRGRDDAAQEGTYSFVSTPSLVATDRSGVAKFRGLGNRERIRVRVSAPGHIVPMREGKESAQDLSSLSPETTAATVYLQGPRTVTWKILEGGLDMPPDNTRVSINALDGVGDQYMPDAGVIRAGVLSVSGWPPHVQTARAQLRMGDGTRIASATLHVGRNAIAGSPISFVAHRTLRIHVQNDDGTPAESVWVLLDDGTNGMMPNAVTDASGFAAIEDLPSDSDTSLPCYVSYTSRLQDGWLVGNVQLHAEDPELTFTIPGPRTVRFTLILNGKPAPAGFNGTLSVSTTPKALVKMGPTGAIEFETDGRGMFEAPLQIASAVRSLQPNIRAVGTRQTGYPTIQVPAAGPIQATIDLRRGFPANVQLRLAQESGPFSMVVHRKSPDGLRWESLAPKELTVEYRGNPNGSAYRLWLPTKGTYRVLDGQTEIATPSFEVGPAIEEPSVVLDLSKTAWVSGRVVLPEGFHHIGTSVSPVGHSINRTATRWAPPISHRGVGRVQSHDGSFRVRIDTSRETKLRAYHPTLRPHATRGYVIVRGARSDVELHMEAGGVARLSLDKPIPTLDRYTGRVRVVITPVDRPHEQEVLVGFIHANRNRIDLRGYLPGRYHMWVDTLAFLPLELRNISLGAGDTDLGTFAAQRGTTLRVRVKDESDKATFSVVTVMAVYLGDLPYTRIARSHGDVIELSGLGAGRFHVTSSYTPTSGRGIDEIIETDGKSSLDIGPPK